MNNAVIHFFVASTISDNISSTESEKGLNIDTLKILTSLLAPFAPHITEEVWEKLTNSNDSIFNNNWPESDINKTKKQKINIAVQVNGKLRANFEVSKDLTKKEIIKLSKKNSNVIKHIENKNIVKEIYIPDKLVNIVITERQ